MYLSKVVLFWPACRDPYQWHKLIWYLFPGRTRRDFQFTCLNRRPGRDISAMLLSMEKPAHIQSAEIALIGEPKSLFKLDFKSGQRLRFRLVANPTKVVTEQTETKRKVRVPLIRQDQQEAWLKKHLDGCAEIETDTIQNETPLFFRRKNKGGKIVPVLIEGILRVTNPSKFKEQIWEKYERENQKEKGRYIAGIGPAKSFGCGLMLVCPA